MTSRQGPYAPIQALHIAPCDFPAPKGSQVYVHARVAGLRGIGVDARVACYGGGTGPDPVPTVRVPARVTVARSGPHPAKPLLDLMLAAVVAREVRAGRVDVLHAHNVEAPFVAALARLLGGRRVPIVYDLHTSLAEELPTYLASGRSAAAVAGGVVDHVLPRLSDACVAISPNASRFLHDHGARQVVELWPPMDPRGVGTPDPDRARAAFDLDDRPWVAYCGNLDAYQDLPILFAAMAGQPKLGLVVVSGGSPATARALAARYGLPPDRLRVVDSGRFVDARDALAAAAVAALPRTRCTGFPIKLLNHHAIGVPTVASAGGVRGLPGLTTVADHDVDAFGAALARLATDPDARSVASAAARSALERHDAERLARSLADLYASLLGRRPDYCTPT